MYLRYAIHSLKSVPKKFLPERFSMKARSSRYPWLQIEQPQNPSSLFPCASRDKRMRQCGISHVFNQHHFTTRNSSLGLFSLYWMVGCFFFLPLFETFFFSDSGPLDSRRSTPHPEQKFWPSTILKAQISHTEGLTIKQNSFPFSFNIWSIWSFVIPCNQNSNEFFTGTPNFHRAWFLPI